MKILTSELSRKFKEIRILPLSDSHIGDKNVSYKKLKETIQLLIDNDNYFAIANGDLINNAIRTGISDIYSETKSPKQALDFVTEMLKPIKDKILVLHPGNHEERTYKTAGIDVLDMVAFNLEISERYSKEPYLLFITFGTDKRNNKHNKQGKYKMKYALYGKHGDGGGKRIGSKANRLEDMRLTIDADVFLHSHTHEVFAFRKPIQSIHYRTNTVKVKDSLFVNSNAFLHFGGYAETKGYSPTSMEVPQIILYSGERKVKALI